jgi:hypothetical protein
VGEQPPKTIENRLGARVRKCAVHEVFEHVDDNQGFHPTRSSSPQWDVASVGLPITVSGKPHCEDSGALAMRVEHEYKICAESCN